MAKDSLVGLRMREPLTGRVGQINTDPRKTAGDSQPIVRVGYRDTEHRPAEGWFLAKEMIPMD